MGKSKKTTTAKRSILDRLKALTVGLGEAVFPEALVCLDCGKELTDIERRYSLCTDCERELPYRSGKFCRYCGDSLKDDGGVCERCLLVKPNYDRLFAPFFYDGFVRRAIIANKDGKQNYLYKYFAKFLADYCLAADIGADIACFVPSHGSKIFARGFEHNKRTTKEFCALTGIEYAEPIKKVKKTKDQSKKNRAERVQNVSGAFGRSDKNKVEIKGKRVLIIDDVVTTGSTVNECARVLKKELGADAVFVLALARR